MFFDFLSSAAPVFPEEERDFAELCEELRTDSEFVGFMPAVRFDLWPIYALGCTHASRFTGSHAAPKIYLMPIAVCDCFIYDSIASKVREFYTSYDEKKPDDEKPGFLSRLFGSKKKEEEEEIDTRPLEFFDGRWHQPVDTLEHLLVNYSYTPKTSIDFKNSIGIDTLKYPGENIYDAGKIYGNNQMSDVDRRINEALIARFGEGISKDKVLEADSLKAHSTAKIWYIGRFLDGFIFDTNIDEVKQIIYGEVASEGEALTFQTADPTENKYILAWNYSLPTLRYGQWAAILSSSTYAYGIKGKVGSHTTSSSVDSSAIDMASYYNMMNYMNNYYGNGYGGMYNNGYYGYNPYYYGYNYGYNPYPSAGTVTTTTTTSAEIPAYAPLLFQVFVENIDK